LQGTVWKGLGLCSHPMRALSLFALVLLAGCAASGLAIANLIARFGSYERVADIAYGENPAQRLDVYTPPGARGAPVVVFLHGGTWSTGTKEQYRFVGQALAARGIVTVVAGYRHYPDVRFPEFVDDAARAVVWAHAQAAQYGGDPDALFVMGHSSGAHMAALVALDPRYLERAGGRPSWIRGMIGLAGPYDFNARREDIRAIFASASDADLSTTQPLTFAKGDPPLLLLHGESDDTVEKRNTVKLAAAVQREGGSACTCYYPGIDHAAIVAALARPLRGTAPVLDDIARFVARVRAGDPGCG
jgi:acetyl esterase/lipase